MKIVGILNLTPDSFSDGMPDATPEFFLKKAQSLIADGADLLDIGGESTRPDSEAISLATEKARVLGFLKLFRQQHPHFPISLDTKKYEVALAAMPFGIAVLNDVSFLHDPRLAILAKHAGCRYVLMHTRGNHAQMTAQTHYTDGLFPTLQNEILAKLKFLRDLDFPFCQLILDPGFGFAKTPEQCVEMMQHLEFWQQFDLPLMFGVSRKRFLQQYCGDVPPMLRDETSAALAHKALLCGFTWLRVHNVACTRRALLASRFSPLAGK